MNPQYAEVHRILGQTESDRQLAILNKALQTYLPGIKNDRELGNAALLWDRRDRTWTKHLEEKHRKRKQPLYTQQDIASLNNAYNVMVAQVNKNRETHMIHLTKLLDEARAKQKTMDDCLAKTANECRTDYDAQVCNYKALERQWNRGQTPPDSQVKVDAINIAIHAIQRRERDFTAAFEKIKSIAKLNEEATRKRMGHVKYLTPSKGEKHWILAQQDTLMGWIPHLEGYHPVCTNKTPSTSDLAKLAESCPFTNTLNLALTIQNYLDHADVVGWKDTQLMHALLLMLKTQRPDLHTKLNVKKSNFFAFFKALIQTCGQNAEIAKCRDYLSKFIRTPEITFMECITNFDSVYTHWQQLLRPVSRQELSDISISTLKQITPFLINDRCAKLFTSWLEQQAHYQTPVTKDSILDVVSRFEAQPDLKLSEKKRLPPHLGFVNDEIALSNSTTVFKTSVQTVDVNYAGNSRQDQKPPFTNRPRSSDRRDDRRPPHDSHRSRTSSPYKQTDRARPRTPRPKSPGPPKPPSRSNSGTRPTNRSRASSNDSAYSNRSTRSNASTESNPSQMREIQKHSSFSRSANKDKTTSTIPSIYRTKSPSAQAALRRHFFTPGEKCDELKNWRAEKRCLRCFSTQHTAKGCHVHRTPAKEPCRLCVHLYHDTKACTRYTLDGKFKQRKN